MLPLHHAPMRFVRIAGTGFSLAPFHPFVKRFCENCSELAENRRRFTKPAAHGMMRAGKSAGGTCVQWAERVRAYVRMHGAGYTLHRAGEMLAARVLLRDEWRFRREKASKRELAVQRAHPFPNVRISVVVPVFNTRPKFLRALADSLLAQTHGVWEVCLYDGGSTSAETRKALEAIAARTADSTSRLGWKTRAYPATRTARLKWRQGSISPCATTTMCLAPVRSGGCGSHRRAPPRRALHR